MNRNTAKSNIIARLTGLSLLVIGFLVVLNVYLSAEVAQDGLAIDTLTKKQETIKRDIARLEQELVAKTSLADLSQKAAELGYDKPQQVVTVRSTVPVAANR